MKKQYLLIWIVGLMLVMSCLAKAEAEMCTIFSDDYDAVWDATPVPEGILSGYIGLPNVSGGVAWGIGSGYTPPLYTWMVEPLAFTTEAFEVTIRGQSGPSWPNQAVVSLLDSSWGGHGQPEIGYRFLIYGESNHLFTISKIGPGGRTLVSYSLGEAVHDWHTYVVSRDEAGDWTLTMDDVNQTPSFMTSDMSYTDFNYIGSFLYRDQSALDYVEVKAPCWELLSGELNSPRHGLTGEALNGYVYAIGGVVMPGSPSDAQNAVSRYNPGSDTWYLGLSMPTARHSLSSAVIEGYIYAVGGHVANSRSENERWNGDPCEPWQSKASVYARSSPGVAAYDGELYVFGGNRYATILSRVDIYNPDTDTWRSGCEMPAATQPGRAVTLGDIIYVNNGDDPNELWAYDPVDCTWDTSLPLMNVSRGNYELQAVCGRIYAIGGSNASDGYLSSVESWAPGEGSWRMEPSLNIARNQFASAVIGCDIYVFGGSNGEDLGSTELLRICTDPVEGDINNDCKVNFKDFAIMASNWLECSLVRQSDCW